jgi:hypothetical protein
MRFVPASAATAWSTGYGTRSIGTLPCPRASRAFDMAARILAPVLAQMRPASSSASARRARWPRISMAGSPESSASAAGADLRVVDARRSGNGGHGRDGSAVAPGRIGREDQGRDLAGGGLRRGDRLGAGLRHGPGILRRLDPARERARHRLDVGGERRVELRW